MRDRRITAVLLLTIVLVPALTSCGSQLPSEAKEVAFSTFDPDERPRISSATKVELQPEDIEAGAEEVWCVNLTFRCFTTIYYGRGEYSTCGDNRLARLVDGEWRISRVITDEDRANWEARGCELMEAVIGLP
jgi:hypothetical protein